MKILSTKQIKARTKTLAKKTATVRDYTHLLLCSIAGHVYTHGDVTMYDSVFEAASGLNRHALAGWIRDFGFASLNQETGKFKKLKSAVKNADFADEQAVFDHLFTEERKWYATEKGAIPVAKDLDVAKRILSIAQGIATAGEKKRKVVVDMKAVKEAITELNVAMSKAS